MIKILDMETASKSILKRTPIGDEEFPLSLLEGVEAIFGEE